MKNNVTAKEFYNKIGGNYEDAYAQCPDDEKLAKKIVRFLYDGSFAELQIHIASGSYKDAYNSAAQLCKQCERYCFAELFAAANRLKEKLDGAELFDDTELFTELRSKYEHTVNALRMLEY